MASGVIESPREDQKYQAYRLHLIEVLQYEVMRLILKYQPDLVANEIVPPVTTQKADATDGTFRSNGMQAQLAATAITAVQSVVIGLEIPLVQIGASTVKTNVGGDKKASKVKVRNGVYERFPEIKDEKWKEWVKVHDESDACAVGIVALSR